MMKKLFSLISVFVFIFALSACKKEKTIKFAVQQDATPALQALVDAFNEKDNGYKVEVQIMTNDSGQMHDQLVQSLSSGSKDYDVVSLDVVWAGEFAAAGYLEPLDTLISSKGWSKTDFNAGSMASGYYSGKQYTLPYFPDLGFLYYRKDIVSQTDATKLESGNYTWDELLTMAETYKGQSGTTMGFAYQSKQYEGLVVNLNEFSDNFEKIREGLETMKEFTDSAATPDDILNYQESETATAFTEGRAVFARNWPYMNGMLTDTSTVKKNQVGLAPLPQGGSVGGWIVGINKNTDVMEGAKEFLAFIAGPEGQKINATKGSYLPGFNDLLEDEDVLEANTLLSNTAFQRALQNTIARPVLANYSEVSDTISTNAHAYLSGTKTLDEAVTAIEGALD